MKGIGTAAFAVCIGCAAAIIALAVAYVFYGAYVVAKRPDKPQTGYTSGLEDYKEIVRETNRDDAHTKKGKE